MSADFCLQDFVGNCTGKTTVKYRLNNEAVCNDCLTVYYVYVIYFSLAFDVRLYMHNNVKKMFYLCEYKRMCIRWQRCAR